MKTRTKQTFKVALTADRNGRPDLGPLKTSYTFEDESPAAALARAKAIAQKHFRHHTFREFKIV